MYFMFTVAMLAQASIWLSASQHFARDMPVTAFQNSRLHMSKPFRKQESTYLVAGRTLMPISHQFHRRLDCAERTCRALGEQQEGSHRAVLFSDYGKRPPLQPWDWHLCATNLL